MKTLNTKVLAIALLLSTVAPAFAAGEGNVQSAPKPEGFFAKAKAKVSNGWNTAKNKTHSFYTTRPEAAAAVTAAGSVALWEGSKALYNFFGQSQERAKANLLKALEAKEFNKVEKAFNKLNKDNKKSVQKSFDAYKAAIEAVGKTAAQRKNRAQAQVETARVALVKAVKALEVTTGFDFSGKAKALFGKVKSNKLATAGIASAVALGAYEGLSYWKFKNNPYTLVNAFNKVKARFSKKAATTETPAPATTTETPAPAPAPAPAAQ